MYRERRHRLVIGATKEFQTPGSALWRVPSCTSLPTATGSPNVLLLVRRLVTSLALLRDFQPTWQKVQDSVAPSGEQVASGEAPATALRAKNRKIEDTDNGRTAIPGITVPLVSDSQGESSRPPGTQRTLDAAWRSSKITVVPQSVIDYLLLRLIVCCALAFSL
jgi:hypothetical protein